jgi:hypothetical protein
MNLRNLARGQECRNKQKTVTAGRPDSVPQGRVAKQCRCGQWFTLPACHANRHKSCSAECAMHARRDRVESRKTICQECGGQFVPRIGQIKMGEGKFCSLSCSAKAAAKTDTWRAARKKAAATRKASLIDGLWVPASGPNHAQWTGGPQAARARYVASGKAAAYVRAYRAANPERAREWTQRRSNQKTTRLPRGTVALLFKLQKAQCAFCGQSIAARYHVDHIVPLSIGGQHEPHNLQLLCPPCNVRKWAFDPIDFAQKHGRLL